MVIHLLVSQNSKALLDYLLRLKGHYRDMVEGLSTMRVTAVHVMVQKWYVPSITLLFVISFSVFWQLQRCHSWHHMFFSVWVGNISGFLAISWHPESFFTFFFHCAVRWWLLQLLWWSTWSISEERLGAE